MKTLTVILFFFLSFQSLAQGLDDIRYVTGKLYLSLYQQADSGSLVLKSLVSGDRLDVIEIAGPYARVITEKDKEGWVKKGFLVKDKPASILYKEANKELEALQKEISLWKENKDSITSLKTELELLQQENKELIQVKTVFLRQKKLNEAKPTLQKTNEKIGLDVFQTFIIEYIYFLIAAFILLILVGFRMGELKAESEVIKHFGGIKVW